MKKSLGKKFGIWMACVLLLLVGCQEEAKDQKDSRSLSKSASEESSEALEILEDVENSDKDNTLDAYMAVTRHALLIEADDKAGGERYVMSVGNAIGQSQGVSCGQHAYGSAENSWRELCIARESGEEIRKRCEYPGGEKMTVYGIGSIWDSNDVLVFAAEPTSDGRHRLSFFDVDETLQIKNEAEVNFFINDEVTYQFAKSCKKDADGRIHVITNIATKDPEIEMIWWFYFVMDETGNKLFEWQDEGLQWPELSFDANGNVILQTRTYHLGRIQPSDRHYLYRWDKDGDGMKLLYEIPVTEENFEWRYYMPSEETVLTVNPKGIYGTREGIEEELYIWGRHGIGVSRIMDLQQTKDGRIQVIYESNDKYWYLSLKETGEKKEVTEVELVTSSSQKDIYQSAANEFNKRFPSYHVSVRDDYDEKLLLTKLIAGDGPVLIDTYLTGFEEQKKLWMPLDNLFTQLGLDGELMEDAVKAGEIDGRLYGVVSNFWIETVVTKIKGSGHWGYKEFLALIKEKPIQAISDHPAGNQGLLLFSDFFNHGLEDNYYLSPEEGLKTDEFLELLDLADEYCANDSLMPMDDSLWPEGGVLCHRVAITKPEYLEAFRMFYGEDVCFVGYPSNEGKGHYLCTISPLTVRNTASVKEKAAALAFIRYLLSEEVQREASKSRNFKFSVRKDVLNAQIRGMEGGTIQYINGYPAIKIKEQPDYEKDEEIFWELIKGSSPKKVFPKELRNVVYGELEEYFGGSISQDMLVDRLKSRIWLYLEEQK